MVGCIGAAEIVRIGILGTGRVVAYGLLAPARKTLGVEVRAVASRSAERAKSFAEANGIPYSFGSYDELLADRSIDAVYIALPPALHCLWAERALESGKHVLCEKPLGVNAGAVRRMLEASERAARVLQEAMHLRYLRVLKRAKNILSSGLLGEPAEVEFCIRHPDLPMESHDFRLSYELGGGACLDLGCYAVACLRDLLGERPAIIGARCECISANVDQWVYANVRFPTGVTGTIECGFRGHYSPRFAIKAGCKLGEMTLDGGGLTYECGEKVVREEVEHEDTYRLQLAEFIQRVHGKSHTPTGADDLLGNAITLDRIYESAGLVPRRDCCAGQ